MSKREDLVVAHPLEPKPEAGSAQSHRHTKPPRQPVSQLQVFLSALSVVTSVVLKSVMKREYNLSAESLGSGACTGGREVVPSGAFRRGL